MAAKKKQAKKAAPKKAAKKATAKKPAPKKAKKAAGTKAAKKAAAPKKARAPKAGAKGGHQEKVNFSESDVRYIRARCFLRERGEKKPGEANDLSQKALAEKFGCSTRTIYAVATKRTYTEVPDVAAEKPAEPAPAAEA